MLINIEDIIGGTRRICKFLPKIDSLKRKKGKMKTYWTLIFTLILWLKILLKNISDTLMPEKREECRMAEYNWFLQDVDGLKPSKFYVIYY